MLVTNNLEPKPNNVLNDFDEKRIDGFHRVKSGKMSIDENERDRACPTNDQTP